VVRAELSSALRRGRWPVVSGQTPTTRRQEAARRGAERVSDPQARVAGRATALAAADRSLRLAMFPIGDGLHPLADQANERLAAWRRPIEHRL
jgi:hypothetical protein